MNALEALKLANDKGAKIRPVGASHHYVFTCPGGDLVALGLCAPRYNTITIYELMDSNGESIKWEVVPTEVA